jgi:alkyldihydroxyacetonephosphate synthase
LILRLRFNKVVSFNEIDQTISVEAGMSGPETGATLNDAKRLSAQSALYLRAFSAELRVFPPSAAG